MEKLDLTLNLDEIIEELKRQESENLIMKGSTVLSLIKEHIAGKLIDSVNLVAEIERMQCDSRNRRGGIEDDFFMGKEWALQDLLLWVKGNI